ncbi:hypothetical protein SAPIO_CDS9107 [Scedosporium apiospermum]|uniref:AAA+ ATPase domain-containing protein n=1 Tax=Pseudallescheria apiosperma TaxID=563466 RepID=A0A084FYD1_PSEDA|nr:uncharacterized protein SAPIO_CDS9107 [Scedosporium apiospermum]KEZ40093.1 hypothetical protein SAPIO_CDS9107 [Scedosporium apiospermum]
MGPGRVNWLRFRDRDADDKTKISTGDKGEEGEGEDMEDEDERESEDNYTDEGQVSRPDTSDGGDSTEDGSPEPTTREPDTENARKGFELKQLTPARNPRSTAGRRGQVTEKGGVGPTIEESKCTDDRRPPGLRHWEDLKHIMISRDRTEDSSFRKDLLIAASGENGDKLLIDDDENKLVAEPTFTRVVAPSISGDYQFQLQLLENKNKRLVMERRERREMERREQEGGVPTRNLPVQPAGVHRSQPAESTSRSKTAINQILELEKQIEILRKKQRDLGSTTIQVLHKIERDDQNAFLMPPSWSLTPDGSLKLIGNEPLANESNYLSRRPDIAFVVYSFYGEGHQKQAIENAKATGGPLPQPVVIRETIRLYSKKMVNAVENFLGAQPTFRKDFPTWSSMSHIDSPFIFWYHYRSSGYTDIMPEPHKSQMQLLGGWIDRNYGQLYQDAEKKFSRGLVSGSIMPFFLRPGEALVSYDPKGIQGHISKSWVVREEPSRSSSWGKDSEKKKARWTVNCWSYSYNGRFSRSPSKLLIELKSDDEHSDIDIAKLRVLPLRLATDEIRIKLEHRGRMMWACRNRKLVAYDGKASLYGHGERYMIDFATYKSLHSKALSSTDIHGPTKDEISDKVMERDEPPKAPELLVFPNKIKGYNLRQKTWDDLDVDLMHNVAWDKAAFKNLVIDDESKDLIEALVTTKLETEQGTDLIKGKGQGLIILLHGGPGTGKTFTAESVAEFAEKPLFRVTCGDIGSKPEEVEKYLESVLHLGKIWDCVVLLDEADVFLEQRTLTDLERNALVSVFLRVLEYYEGILILTSNRVGTFDEAFKSRILLSLHYEPLTKEQRRKIWKNFFDRLKTLEEDAQAREIVGPLRSGSSRKRKREDEESKGIDFGEIECCLAELAEEEMNGRQIRNAITTARQVAKFKGVRMSSAHLKQVIRVSGYFEAYLKKVQDGYTDDQVARGEGIR